MVHFKDCKHNQIQNILIVQVGNIIYQLSDSVALKYLHASESPVELVKTQIAPEVLI